MNRQALIDLRDAVTTEGVRPYQIVTNAMQAFDQQWELASGIACAYDGSLDAANALHETVLPGYVRAVDATAPEAGIEVKVFPPGATYNGDEYSGPSIGDHKCESRAWLLAILEALIQEGGSDDQ